MSTYAYGKATPVAEDRARFALAQTMGSRRVFGDSLTPLGELDYGAATVERFRSGQDSRMMRLPLVEPVTVRLSSVDYAGRQNVRTDWNGCTKRTAARLVHVTAVLVHSPDDSLSWDVDKRYRTDKLYYVGALMAGKPGALRPHARAHENEWHEIRGDFSSNISRTFEVVA